MFPHNRSGQSDQFGFILHFLQSEITANARLPLLSSICQDSVLLANNSRFVTVQVQAPLLRF